jgi:hypothetical protein
MRSVMAGISQSELLVWMLTAAIEAGLAVSMIVRGYHKRFPAFFSYVCVDLLQCPVLIAAYSIWGFSSPRSEHFGWGTQGIVLCARGLAVAEVCWNLLGQFAGIWALARRILLSCAFFVALYSILKAGWKWNETVLKADKGLELTIVVVLVVLFLFARYYEIVPESAVRTIAVGFFLFSCFTVVNDTILQIRLSHYEDLWRFRGSLVFIGSLSLWISAFRKPLPETRLRPALISGDIYRAVAPEVNLRLRLLNEQLSKFGRLGAHRS